MANQTKLKTNTQTGKPVELPARLDSFYVRFKQYALLTALAGQVAVGFLIGGMVWFLGPQLSTDMLLVTVLIGFFVLEVFATLAVMNTVLKPTETFSNALVYISGENGHVVAPNVYTSRDEKSGLKGLVQVIYQKAAESHVDPSPTAKDATPELLAHLPVGVTALGLDGSIIYSNASAPIRVDKNNRSAIALLFDGDDSFDAWLARAQQQKVSDIRFWQGISDKGLDSPDRRVYDVLASYERGMNDQFETILITIDRSGAYKSLDEDVDFIALAAHELRGPITVIRGYLDVLRDELASVLKPDQFTLLDRLNVSASNLSGYINNILNVSKYDRAHLKLYPREMHLADVYSAVRDDLALRAKTQNRLLSVDIPSDLPTVAADSSSVGEVFTNFVDNAIKYSREGGQVAISAKQDGNYVKVSVVDHGIGIATSVIDSLFTKFYRSHRSRESVAGTGLGLYISKAIVESHGGQIGVSSREGEGSMFTFTLPIYRTVEAKLKASLGANEGIIETSSGWIKNHNLYKK
jgi:signal transduction histidine kinase